MIVFGKGILKTTKCGFFSPFICTHLTREPIYFVFLHKNRLHTKNTIASMHEIDIDDSAHLTIYFIVVLTTFVNRLAELQGININFSSRNEMFGNLMYCNEPSFIVLVESTFKHCHAFINGSRAILPVWISTLKMRQDTGISWKVKISVVCYLRWNGRNGSGNERSELSVADIFWHCSANRFIRVCIRSILGESLLFQQIL